MPFLMPILLLIPIACILTPLSEHTIGKTESVSATSHLEVLQPEPRIEIRDGTVEPADTNKRKSPDEQFFPVLQDQSFPAIFAANPQFVSDGFDFPVGKPDGSSYYKALEFGQKNHLGEDWNGVGGGNTDLGDPVFAVANGLVTYADDVCCGWGNVVRMVHFTGEDDHMPFVETIYAHLHEIEVEPGDLIHRGTKIGTIGNAHGKYAAHLHFEMRDFINMSLGPGYSLDKEGYLAPTEYIKAHRPVSATGQ